MAHSIAEHKQAIAEKPLKGAYDYIVVGAGAAGSVVAGELSKTGAEVLVIESGPADTAPTIGNPSVWFYNVAGPLDFALPIKPAPQVNNRGFNIALGHVLGGGSSINAMVWTRGMERDYDSWAEHCVNINRHVARAGTRVSAARAFLHPNLSRANLTLLLGTNVTKVLFDGDRASGVEFAAADGARRVSAAREVILSAGTIHTVQLLMLSGVGGARALKKLGIAPVADLRGVGRDFQDHQH